MAPSHLRGRPAAVLALLAVSTGCTHWGFVETTAGRRQVGLVRIGEPHLEETTESDVAAGEVSMGFVGTDGVAYREAALGGRTTTMSRTRCVQAALVDFEETIEYRPQVQNRSYDLLVASLLVITGAALAGLAREDYHAALDDYESDVKTHQRSPDFFPMPGPMPSEPVGTYQFGAALGASGLLFAGVSLLALPLGKRPPPRRVEERYTTRTYVDAVGCTGARE